MLGLLMSMDVVYGQGKPVFSGQFSSFINYSPQSALPVMAGGRYVPQLDYKVALDSTQAVDFEAGVLLSGYGQTDSFRDFTSDFTFKPYRLWARYTNRHTEVRLGLQQIDFGPAMILRPMQWFDQIDPRDPLRHTQGQYGLLGRYYFTNNANIWLWTLYGNRKGNVWDLFDTHPKYPAFGGRAQVPIPKGEAALSFHHRTGHAVGVVNIPDFEIIPENRIGLDAKVDLGIGLWAEFTTIARTKDLNGYTHQRMAMAGADYTFGIGNGLTVIAEQLTFSLAPESFEKGVLWRFSALSLNYPLTALDRVSGLMYRNWRTDAMVWMFNYQHDFRKWTGYVIGYWNPKLVQVGWQSDLESPFSGPGFRFMMVYNH